MTPLYMITFRCGEELYTRMEAFSDERNLDRTSVMKMALHYYLNRDDRQRSAG